MDTIKFPINSMEIYFMSMISGVIAYCIGSWLTCKDPYNLDRLFHRGQCSDSPGTDVPAPVWTWKNLYNNIVGITPEYTTGDKVIAWSVVVWSLVYGFGIMFCGVLRRRQEEVVEVVALPGTRWDIPSPRPSPRKAERGRRRVRNSLAPVAGERAGVRGRDLAIPPYSSPATNATS
jgi:hypothetical protein